MDCGMVLGLSRAVDVDLYLAISDQLFHAAQAGLTMDLCTAFALSQAVDLYLVIFEEEGLAMDLDMAFLLQQEAVPYLAIFDQVLHLDAAGLKTELCMIFALSQVVLDLVISY